MRFVFVRMKIESGAFGERNADGRPYLVRPLGEFLGLVAASFYGNPVCHKTPI